MRNVNVSVIMLKTWLDLHFTNSHPFLLLYVVLLNACLVFKQHINLLMLATTKKILTILVKSSRPNDIVNIIEGEMFTSTLPTSLL